MSSEMKFDKVQQLYNGHLRCCDNGKTSDDEEASSKIDCSSCASCVTENHDAIDTDSTDVLEGDLSYIRWEPMHCPISGCGKVIGKSAFAQHYFEQVCINAPPVAINLGEDFFLNTLSDFKSVVSLIFSRNLISPFNLSTAKMNLQKKVRHI